MMNVHIKHDRFKSVVGDGVKIEQLATGFTFTEGPVWHPDRHDLIFSDIPGNAMHRWTKNDGVTVFRSPSNMANGNAYDLSGRLVTCEHATSRVIRTEPDGSITVLASHYEERELNSPNDVTVRSDGWIYFSDPSFGRRKFFGVAREQQQRLQGVFRVSPDGKLLELAVDDFEQPNGLSFSPDESLLFVNDTPRAHIRVFEVAADGTLSGGAVWAEVHGEGVGVADGLKCDSEGNVYCTGPGGIHVFDSSATWLGVIRMPEKTSNFTWGDADLRSLFVTASTSLYRVRVAVAGRRAF